jgi:protein ImuA
MNPQLEPFIKNALLRHGKAIAPQRTLPSGFTDLDRVLPGGGWPIGALTEILNSNDEGIGELSLLMPAIAAASRTEQGVMLVNAPYIPFPAAWLAKGVALDNCSFIATDNLQEALWSTEQSLLSGTCSLVIFWQPEGKAIDYKSLHRLHLAALNGKTPAILFRPRRDSNQASPAALRLLVTAMTGELAVRVIKRRDIPLDHAVYLTLHPVTWKRRQASLHSHLEQALFIQEAARSQVVAH